MAAFVTIKSLLNPASVISNRMQLPKTIVLSCLAMMNNHHHQHNNYDISNYLQETLDNVLDGSNKCFAVTEQDRKTMVRGVLGGTMTKVDLDQQLRQVKIDEQWLKAKAFLSQKFLPLVGDGHFNTEGPLLSAADTRPIDSFPTATKYFSYLAKGRTFQGRFERLLESVAPDLSESYEETVQDIDRVECLRLFANNYPEGDRDNILKCVNFRLPKSSPQPSDGGFSSGKKGEMDLETYLRSSQAPLSGEGDQQCEICVNVLVKPSKSRIKKGQHFVIETANLTDGSTTEFDAMLVQRTADGAAVRIIEVWEAKAAIHPITLADVVFKKVKSLEGILEDEEAQFWIDGVHYPIDTTTPPSVGIFGSNILHPKGGATRVQVVEFQKQLGSSPELVQTVLENDGIGAAPDVTEQLRKLMDEIDRLQPTVIIGRDLQ